jgi:hypothetical protein
MGAKPGNDSLTYPIKQIYLDYSFRPDSFSIDTSINKLHILNPAFFTEPSNTFLTTLGYPIESNYIVSRLNVNEVFFPAISLLPYLHDSRQNFFYDTKRQFTSLTYKTEGGTSNSEEELRVAHTQNLTKQNNIGLLFDIFSSYSRYNSINGNDYNIKSFYRHSGENFLTYNQIYYNSLKLQENGGISDDNLLDYTIGNNNGISVNLENANSRLKRLGFNSINEFKLKAIFNKKDTTGKDYGSLFYNFNIEKNKRDYFDNDENSSFYTHSYINKTASRDSIVLTRLSNKFILNSPGLSKYLPNLRLSLTNDIFFAKNGIYSYVIAYNHNVVTKNYKNTESSTYASLDISQKFRQIQWNVIWDSYLVGYNAGDQKLKLEATTYINRSKTLGLSVDASQENKTPSFLLDNYFSNHFVWQRTFKRENRENLSATFFIKNPSIKLKTDYTAVSNYVYFGADTLPLQANNTMHILSFRFDNNIDVWKINFENSIIYQKNSSKSYIHVPDLIIYNSTSFFHTFHFFTGGRLFFKLGFDLYYTSLYNPDAYNPSTGTFYLQNIMEEGNYPKVDLHLTIKVKTLSFYIKYSHLNAGLNGPREFNALHYPMLPATLSYGINWLFYD